MSISTWENLISCHWPGFAFVVSQIGWPRLVLTINVRGCKLILPQKITFHFLSIKIQHQSQFLYSNRIHAQILTNSNFLRTWKIWPIFVMVLICMWWIYLTYFTRLNKGVCFWNLELPLNILAFIWKFSSDMVQPKTTPRYLINNLWSCSIDWFFSEYIWIWIRNEIMCLGKCFINNQISSCFWLGILLVNSFISENSDACNSRHRLRIKCR